MMVGTSRPKDKQRPRNQGELLKKTIPTVLSERTGNDARRPEQGEDEIDAAK